VNRAVARLHAGRFAEAWQDEDWVLAEPGRVVLPAQKLLPPLSVLPDLTGRTVLWSRKKDLATRYNSCAICRCSPTAVRVLPSRCRRN
jgi:hypothetical protein